MKLLIRIFMPLMIVYLAACNSSSTKSNQETLSEDSVKTDVSELTYLQIYQLVLEQTDGRGMDFHGDGYGQDAVGDLKFAISNPCGENDCGKLMSIVNGSEREIVAVVKGTFNLPGNPNQEMIREYEVPANSQTVVGCSHLCYDGESYKFSREVISAGYKPAE